MMFTPSIKICLTVTLLFVLSVTALANDDCAELLTRDGELTLDQRFQAYVSDLLQEGVLGTAQLKAYRKNLKKGIVANPVTESVARTNYQAQIHQDSLQEYVDSGDLTLEGQLAWVENKLHKLKRQQKRKSEVSEEIRKVNMDVTSPQWWEKATDRMLSYIDPNEQFVGDVKIIDDSGNIVYSLRKRISPLHFAAEHAPYNKVKKYLEIHRGKLDVDSSDEWEETALFRTIVNQEWVVAKLLISKGANVNAINKYNDTPLHLASEYGKAKMVKYLISANANIHDKNEYGYTPLHWASENGHDKVVKLLLTNGADHNTKNEYGDTPLHLASMEGYAKTTELLIAANANIHAKNNNDNTPLHLASEYRQDTVVKILLAAGANIHAKNNNDNTPLHWASLSDDNTKTVKLLLAAGAKVNAINKYGDTPLHWASCNGHPRIVELLLANGSYVNAKNEYGVDTPLHLASENGHDKVVKLLLTNGADHNTTNEYGDTPLDVAIKEGYDKVAEILLATNPAKKP